MTPLVEQLSAREEQVLVLLADGLGLGEIAEQLGIRRSTAKTHRDNGRRKLGAATTTQAVAIVVRIRTTETATA